MDGLHWIVGASREELCETYMQHAEARRDETVNSAFLAVYNVHFFLGPQQDELTRNDEAIWDAIESLDSQVLVLNEFFPVARGSGVAEAAEAFANRLSTEMGYKYSSMDGSPDYREVSFVTVVFSRLPFVVPAKQIRIVDRFAVHVMLEGGLDILGVHLDVYDDSGDLRVRQVKVLLDYIEQKSRKSMESSACWILAGDLNALRPQDYNDEQWSKLEKHDALRGVKLDARPLQMLELDGFVDSFAICKLPPPLCTTWSCRRIDYILIKDTSSTHRWILSDARVVYSAASDHFPITCNLTTM